MLGKDVSYSHASRFYTKQQPDGQTFNGVAVVTEVVLDTGGLFQHYGQEAYNGVVMPAIATQTIAVGGANIAQVTFQVADGGGNAVVNGGVYLVYLSDSAVGAGLTATTPSGGIALNAGGGTLVSTPVASKMLQVMPNASGQIVLNITDTGHTGYYVCLAGLPCTQVTRQLTAADY